jgi:hypothetical protein
VIDPEADPAEHHDEDAGQIGLEDEVADVALELEAEGKPLVNAGGELLLAVVRLVADYRELGKFRLVDAPHWCLLPGHHDVQYRVAICAHKSEPRFLFTFIPDAGFRDVALEHQGFDFPVLGYY